MQNYIFKSSGGMEVIFFDHAPLSTTLFRNQIEEVNNVLIN